MRAGFSHAELQRGRLSTAKSFVYDKMFRIRGMRAVPAGPDRAMATRHSPNTFRFSTEDYPERDRLAAWRDIFGRTVVNLNIEPLTVDLFHCDATVCARPGLGLLVGGMSGVHLSHSSDLIVDDDLSFMVGPTGDWTACQLGRNPVLGSGDGVLMWNAEVGSMSLPSDSRFTTFRVPVAAIAPLVPDVQAHIATRIPAQSMALRLLSRYLEIFRDAPAMTPEMQHLAVSHVHDLLALTLGASPDAAEVAKGRGLRAARLRAIKTDIIENLARVDLSVAAIAAKHGVTPRYVQMLFEDEGTTFTAFTVKQRLARAHRLLTDRRHARRTIGAIAFEVGFGDLSYFNRIFRRRFGATPSDVRAAGAKAGDGEE
jgi:AraC-like DNA-binding protein